MHSESTLGSTLGMSSFLANAIMIMVLRGTLGKFPTLETREESPYTTGVVFHTLNKILVEVGQTMGQCWSILVDIGQKNFLVKVTQMTNIQRESGDQVQISAILLSQS